ncbi:MAG: hypothetical protein U9O94_02940 [Nanoarchaeota archaeon]|nr:hypothetical protein [Nanoarchaeota archaeon]
MSEKIFKLTGDPEQLEAIEECIDRFWGGLEIEDITEHVKQLEDDLDNEVFFEINKIHTQPKQDTMKVEDVTLQDLENWKKQDTEDDCNDCGLTDCKYCNPPKKEVPRKWEAVLINGKDPRDIAELFGKIICKQDEIIDFIRDERGL